MAADFVINARQSDTTPSEGIVECVSDVLNEESLC
jgi:hypothetical protein